MISEIINKKILIFLSTINLLSISLIIKANEELESLKRLDQYKNFLIAGTYQGQDWSAFKVIPKSRYDTFAQAFSIFEKNKGKIIVELGTTRSFLDGKYAGCMSTDIRYWQPNNPETWDWGAGSFTRVTAECLSFLNPEFHSIDISPEAIYIAKVMTLPFESFMNFHKCSSLDFLRNWDSNKKIDLLYLDTGNMDDFTCKLQLEEAKILVERDLISNNGIILIDDVKNQTPRKLYGETSDLGKSKYSIPYLISKGFTIISDEYQVILIKK